MRAKSKAAPAAPTVKTVEQDMVPPDDADFSRVPVWNDADIVAHFKLSRDIRNILPITPIPFPPGQQVTNTAPLEFIRRLSWQYPNDGCFARAELVTSMVTDPAMRPYKLFSFGDLVVSSDNDDEPVVWWYHVVPVVRSASTSEPWVLDAAIDPSQPLPWRTWLVTQGPFIDGVTVADSYAYTPGSPVTGGSWYKDHAMLVMQNEFLHREWDRQVDLGRDPYARFGEYPPWYRLERFYFVSIDPGLIVPSCLTCLGSNALLPRCLADCE